jgi:hypothetical protein
MTRLLAATRKGLFEIDDDLRRVARAHFLGARVSYAFADPRDGTWYAALDHGHFGAKLHRSDDRGDTWTELAAPAYPPKPEGLRDICPIRQIERPWNTELVWTIEAGHTPGELWAGTIPGGVFRSTDRGDTWALIDALWNHPSRLEWAGGGYDYPGVHSIVVDPRSPGRVLVGVSTGGTWFTEDGGTTWDVAHGMRAAYMPDELQFDPVAQDPHRVVACEREPDVLWTQHHSGMFRSVDAGRTWTEITDVEPSVFGFAVAAHPHDPDTAWFVPAHSDEVRMPVDGRVVVTKTTDGGRTFRACTTGLPQQDAYDLVYRHALVVDSTGDQLALGSTGGSLWVSDDSGESFRTVNTSLPPIASLAWC